MDYFPQELIFRNVVAMVLFLVGWLGCGLAVRRALQNPRASAWMAGGFVLWNALIVFTAVALTTFGIFSVWAFIGIPLLLAAGGIYWGCKDLNIRSLIDPFRDIPIQPLMAIGCVAGLIFFHHLMNFNLRTPTDAWDTFAYHRAMSAMLLDEGVLFHLPTSIFQTNNFPKNGEIVAAWVLGLAHWDGPMRVLPILNLFVLMLGIYWMLRQWEIERGPALLLSLTSAGFPGMLAAVSRDVGDVDINLAAATIVGFAAVSAVINREGNALRYGLLACLSAALIYGIKAVGPVYTFFIAVYLAIAMAWIRPGWKPFFILLGAGVGLTLIISSYWNIYNYAGHKNPLYPIPVMVGETEVFPGWDMFKGDDMSAVTGLPEPLRGRTPFGRFLKSMKTLNMNEFVCCSHVGGWGYHFKTIVYPFWFIGFGLSLIIRRWSLAFTMALLSGLFLVTPSYWWARFSLTFMAAGVLAVIPVYHVLRRVKLHYVLAGVWCVSAYTYTVNIVINVTQRYTARMVEEHAEDQGRSYAIPQDAFRVDRHGNEQRDAYRWIGEHLPKDTALGYDTQGGEVFPGLMYRPDYQNAVQYLRFPENPGEDYDYLLLDNKEDHREAVSGFGLEIVYQNGKYLITRHPNAPMPENLKN